jgi:glutamyl-tRNA reductase
MPIFVCGINHKTAPVALLERVLFTQEKCAFYFHDLMANENIHEAVLLSTCNRSELYCEADSEGQVMDWFCRQHQVPRDELLSAVYLHRDQAAVEHIMNVACGLDSLVLGESQILAQMKQAFGESCAAGAVGATFHRLFQQVFAAAKEVRTNTAIGACPVSISSAAVNFMKTVYPERLDQATVLVIGAGATVDLVLRYLKMHMPQRVLIINRSKENAEMLAKQYEIEWHDFSKLPEGIAVADIIISATGSTLPVVTKPMIAERKKPLFIIDIAVPRDVEVTVGDCEKVHLYSIDDLKVNIQQNSRDREHVANKAREMIAQKSQQFLIWLNSLDKVAKTICAYRKQIEDLCRIELIKATKQLQRGDDPLQVLNVFAHGLTNKLLHAPSVQLRQAGFEGRMEILELAQQLLAIPEPTDV